MGWDPVVLRKYNTTGHFRLLNQVRSELKGNPLVRPKEGERVADVNRSRALVRALEGRGSSGGRNRRSSSRDGQDAVVQLATTQPRVEPGDEFSGSDIEAQDTLESASFRERLNAVDLR